MSNEQGWMEVEKWEAQRVRAFRAEQRAEKAEAALAAAEEALRGLVLAVRAVGYRPNDKSALAQLDTAMFIAEAAMAAVPEEKPQDDYLGQSLGWPAPDGPPKRGGSG